MVTLTAGTGGVAGSYDISLFQTATHEKMISGDSLISDQNASLSSLGISTGTFSIGGVEIDVDADDSIQDLRMKINSATDSDGNSIGVTATVLKLSDTNYRMVLSSEDTGSDGVEYKDLNGDSVLQDLGIINDAAGDKGITSQSISSAADINSAFSALAVGDAITYSAIGHDGNEITNTFIKSSTNTIDDLVDQISDSYSGMADVSIDAGTGSLIITDKTSGQSSLAMNSFNMDGTDYAFNMDEVGFKGSNVLSVGKDAFFSVDGLMMQSEKNSASGFITGVTIDFHKASYDETVTIDMKKDYDKITENVQSLVNSYNALSRYVNSSTKYGDFENDNDGAGALAGDMTTKSILSQVRSLFSADLDPTNSGEYGALSMIGLKTDTATGEFTLDSSEFSDALKENFDDVKNMFASRGFADNNSIVVGKTTTETEEGLFNLVEIDPSHYQYTHDGTTYTSSTRNGDIVSFADGPLSGLMLTAPAGSGDTNLTISKGLTGNIEKLIDKLTDAREGTVSMRKESWGKTIDRLDDRILNLEDRIESFRLRLVKQFAAMEQTMQSLNSQSSNMMSQLGYYSQQ
jgi:flagellar hook-associated protein 2